MEKELLNKAISELELIRLALEKLSPKEPIEPKWGNSNAYLWNSEIKSFSEINEVNRIPIELLKGIDLNIKILHDNTKQFSKKLPANNALLWGSRGMGKSSIIKAIHHEISLSKTNSLKLIEVHREDIEDLPIILGHLKKYVDYSFIVFCDDLSFDGDDTTYKSLKAALEGGLEGKPKNVIFYATSNRRHLMPRDMIENESSTAINPNESIEEKVSLSDRFGLWIGFHNCSQSDYLEMIKSYAEYYKINIDKKDLNKLAISWAAGRGSRSGRVAWQFINNLAGQNSIELD